MAGIFLPIEVVEVWTTENYSKKGWANLVNAKQHVASAILWVDRHLELVVRFAKEHNQPQIFVTAEDLSHLAILQSTKSMLEEVHYENV